MPYYIKPKKKTEGEKKRKSPNKKKTLINKLDRVFSEYIRLRDSARYQFKYFSCISCGQVKPYSQMDCGHYYSRRYMATRWDEQNCNGECKGCNRFSADHLDGYRRNLILKIGQQKMDLLTWKKSQTKKWSEFELEQLYLYYDTLVKSVKKKYGLN